MAKSGWISATRPGTPYNEETANEITPGHPHAVLRARLAILDVLCPVAGVES